MKAHNFVKNLLGIDDRDMTVVIEFNSQWSKTHEARLDLPFNQVCNFLVEDLCRGRVPHVATSGVMLRRGYVSGDHSLLLYPEPVDVVLKSQTGREERGQTECIVIAGDTAIHPPVLFR